MIMNPAIVSAAAHRAALLATLLLALPLTATAQSESTSMDMHSMPGMAMPATPSSTGKPATEAHARSAKKKTAPTPSARSSHDMTGMKGMDHGAMPNMPTPTTPAASTAPVGERSGTDHASMPDMHPDAMSGRAHGSMSGMDSMSGMTMGPMQGGSPPPNARSPDYSDGVGYGSMKGMDMADDASLGMLLIDQLEAFNGSNANGQSWEAEGWYGNDKNKLWIRSEGERSHGSVDDGDVEAFWNRNVATYWSTQLGVRQDVGAGPKRTWAALGMEGLAPYWFEVQATAYVSAAGRTAARLRADYDMRFTQRLILQPELEANLYGKNDPRQRVGSGLSDVELGLRLRYEIHRQFAPYIGISWLRRIGTTADYARQDHQSPLDRQFVAGVRLWF